MIDNHLSLAYQNRALITELFFSPGEEGGVFFSPLTSFFQNKTRSSNSMPYAQKPLHQYPSLQTMRHVEGPHIPVDYKKLHHQLPRPYDMGDSPVGIRDFQSNQWSPSRRPSTPRPATSPKANPITFPPLPDLHQDLSNMSEVNRSDSCMSNPTLIQTSNIGHQYSPNSGQPSAPAYDLRIVSPKTSPGSVASSNETYETHATSLELPALQTKTALERSDQMRPISGELPGSFDLVVPAEAGHQSFSLEARSEELFSRQHLEIIFSDPSLLLRFTAFLSTYRPQSVPILIYYLDALKAIRAIKYANAIAEALSPISGHEFTASPAEPTINIRLEEKAKKAFDVLVQEDLPAYISQTYIQVVSLSISRRITGTLAPHLREASEGLAEVFCLTDPSRPDNPIVFTSEGQLFLMKGVVRSQNH